MDKSFFDKDIGIPILGVNTETFAEAVKIYQNKEKVDSVFEHANSMKNQLLNCVIKRTDHLHQCDMVWVMNGELKLFKMLKSNADVYEQIHINRCLIKRFIEKVVVGKSSAKAALEEVEIDLKQKGISPKEILVSHGCGA